MTNSDNTYRVDIYVNDVISGQGWEPHFHGTLEDCEDERDDIRDNGGRARIVPDGYTDGLTPAAIALLAKLAGNITEDDNPAPDCTYCGKPVGDNEWDSESGGYFSSHFGCSSPDVNGAFGVEVWRNGASEGTAYGSRRFTTDKRARAEADHLARSNYSTTGVVFQVVGYGPDASQAGQPIDSYPARLRDPREHDDKPGKPSTRNVALRATYWNAERQTWVSVYDGVSEGLDTSSGRWQVVCERHSTILSVDTLKLAHEDARNDPAEFCEECRPDDNPVPTNPDNVSLDHA